jgi:hypothetical protein
MQWNGIAIQIHDVFPPVPSRAFDFCASLGDWDDCCKAYEYGPTREIAVANLLQTLYDNGD